MCGWRIPCWVPLPKGPHCFHVQVGTRAELFYFTTGKTDTYVESVLWWGPEKKNGGSPQVVMAEGAGEGEGFTSWGIAGRPQEGWDLFRPALHCFCLCGHRPVAGPSMGLDAARAPLRLLFGAGGGRIVREPR